MSNKFDIYISNGDHVETSGNYTQTQTVAAKLVRSVMAKRGYWPGGRDEVIGNDTWNNRQLKESDRQKVLAWFGESIQWMVDDQLIVVKNIELGKVDNADVILVTVFDISERLEYQYPAPIPWNE